MIYHARRKMMVNYTLMNALMITIIVALCVIVMALFAKVVLKLRAHIKYRLDAHKFAHERHDRDVMDCNRNIMMYAQRLNDLEMEINRIKEANKNVKKKKRN